MFKYKISFVFVILRKIRLILDLVEYFNNITQYNTAKTKLFCEKHKNLNRYFTLILISFSDFFFFLLKIRIFKIFLVKPPKNSILNHWSAIFEIELFYFVNRKNFIFHFQFYSFSFFFFFYYKSSSKLETSCKLEMKD